MNINTGCLSAVMIAVAAFCAPAGATEIQATADNSLLAAVSGTRAELDFSIPSGAALNTAAASEGAGALLLTQLSVVDGETFTLTPAINGTVFLGLSSATPVASYVMSTKAESQLELADFYGAASNQTSQTKSTPAAEVATAVMIGSGLLIIGARRKVFSNLSRSQS
jgi:hypothetical protein